MEYLFGRFSLVTYTVTGSIAFAALGLVDVMFFVPAVVLGALGLLGISDYTQKKRAVLGNYPLLGRFRFIFESVRPELRQYFWESDTDELPYSRNQRAMVYQRAKGILATRPFGSDQNMYAENFNWLNHSLLPSHIEMRDFRIRVGEGDKAYDASVLNISGTSVGALSPPPFSHSRRVQSWGALRIILAKDHYQNIMKLVAVTRFGKFQQVTLVVEQNVANLIRRNSKRKPHSIK